MSRLPSWSGRSLLFDIRDSVTEIRARRSRHKTVRAATRNYDLVILLCLASFFNVKGLLHRPQSLSRSHGIRNADPGNSSDRPPRTLESVLIYLLLVPFDVVCSHDIPLRHFPSHRAGDISSRGNTCADVSTFRISRCTRRSLVLEAVSTPRSSWPSCDSLVRSRGPSLSRKTRFRLTNSHAPLPE